MSDINENKNYIKFNNELEFNERIVYSDTWLRQTGFGIFLMLFGYGLAVLMIYLLSVSAINGNLNFDMLVILSISTIGMLLFGQLGLHSFFIRTKNCIIVTNKRLALRGTGFLFRASSRDVPIDKICNTSIVDFQINGKHNHYRLRVDIDKGKRKRKPKQMILIPKNAHALAQVMSIMKVS